jgi:hypothetical protein
MSRKRKFEEVNDDSDADEPVMPAQKEGINLEELPYSRPNSSHVKNKMRNKYQLQILNLFGFGISDRN